MGIVTAVISTFIVTRWVGPWLATTRKEGTTKAVLRVVFGGGGPGEERKQQ